MGIVGHKSKRGTGDHYAEVKDQQVILAVTKTARRLIDAKVRAYGDATGVKLSRSEFFERWARDLL